MSKKIKKYDVKENVIYLKSDDGIEIWYDHDERNNLIHQIDSDGFEIWREYDADNRQIHYKESDGLEIWIDYENGTETVLENGETTICEILTD